jgi:hypothetical protein
MKDGTLKLCSCDEKLTSDLQQPHVRDFETPSPALAFLGVVLAIVGLCDLVTLSLPEEISLLHHWGVQGTSSPSPSTPANIRLNTDSFRPSTSPPNDFPCPHVLHLLLLALLAPLHKPTLLKQPKPIPLLDLATRHAQQRLQTSLVTPLSERRLHALRLGRRRAEEQGLLHVRVRGDGELVLGLGYA